MSRPTSTRSDKPPAPWWPTLRQGAAVWLLAWATAGLCAAVGGFALMQSGLYDVAATTPDNPLVAWALHNTMIHSKRLRAHFPGTPPSATPERIAAGAVLYRSHCEQCHGGPGVPRAPWASGLAPPPPFLLDSARHWTPKELRQIIAGGVKMTAMPAWSTSLSEGDIESLTVFVGALPTVTPANYQMAARPPSNGQPPEQNTAR